MAKKERIDTHQPIGNIIQQLREANRYTKTQFAKMVGVSKNHIGEVEAGACFPSHARLIKMLYILGHELTVRRIPKFPQNANLKDATEEVVVEKVNATEGSEEEEPKVE